MLLIIKFLSHFSFLSENAIGLAAQFASAIILIVLTLLISRGAQFFFARMLRTFVFKGKSTQWERALTHAGSFRAAGYTLSALIAIQLYPVFVPIEYAGMEQIMSKLIGMYIILCFLGLIISCVNLLDYFYGRNPNVPLKGLFQGMKIVLYLLAALALISLLISKKPIAVIGALSALAAVFSLIFKDAILGFAAGIQLASNKLVKIGDWIEMPSHGADGNVIDISLTTVRVQNFDNTIINIPAYDLISKPFKNWSGMYDAKARRIKRSINIDVATVRFLDLDMLQHLQKIKLIQNYLKEKQTEIRAFNDSRPDSKESLLNGRHLTNIGTFRMYAQAYLSNHPQVRHDMTCMVRQLDPQTTGLPLEVYCFADTTEWLAYEGIQADIFDHLYAVMPEFELFPFQEPSGRNITQLMRKTMEENK